MDNNRKTKGWLCFTSVALQSILLLNAPLVMAKATKSSSKSVEQKSSGMQIVQDSAECKECIKKAQQLFAQDNIKEALAVLNANESKCANSMRYNLLYSTILLRSKDGQKQAAVYAKRAQSLDPSSLVANLQAGITAMITDNKKEALFFFKKTVALDPGSYEAWSSLGKLHGELGNSEQEKVCAAKAACLEPKSRQAKIRMLRGIADSGSIQALRKELDKMIDDESIEPEFFPYVAKEAYELGVFDKAERACDRVLQAYPNSLECRKIKVLSLLWQNKYKEASLILAENKSLTPELMAVSVLIGLKTNDTAQSAKLTKALDSEPDSPVVLLTQGINLEHQKQYQEAIVSLRKSLKQNELFAPSHIELCRIYIKEKDFESALQEAREIGRCNGFEAIAKAMEARVNLAQSTAVEKRQKADLLARQAFKMDENAPEVLISLARVHLSAGRVSESKKLAEKALMIEPGNDDAILLVSEIKGNDRQ
ncbi:MAG: hypothetical protein SFY67_11230 [Candidatus Melainabacteria bacterium]|nr:hypothetical protein [Candidatus Melainabacteria bacterium]